MSTKAFITAETMLLSTNAQEPYGIKRIDKYFQAIDKITKEDIMQAARLYSRIIQQHQFLQAKIQLIHN